MDVMHEPGVRAAPRPRGVSFRRRSVPRRRNESGLRARRRTTGRRKGGARRPRRCDSPLLAASPERQRRFPADLRDPTPCFVLSLWRRGAGEGETLRQGQGGSARAARAGRLAGGARLLFCSAAFSACAARPLLSATLLAPSRGAGGAQRPATRALPHRAPLVPGAPHVPVGRCAAGRSADVDVGRFGLGHGHAHEAGGGGGGAAALAAAAAAALLAAPHAVRPCRFS